MRAWGAAIVLSLLMPHAAAQLIRLEPGVPRRFSFASQPQSFLRTGIIVAAPVGATRLTIDLETDQASADLNLFARFDREVELVGGVIQADFAAHTPAGREQLIITANSVPPLQSGIYYLAIGVVTVNTAVSGTIGVTVEGGGAGGTLILATFGSDADGWTRNFPISTVPSASLGDTGAFTNWESAGGAPGGYFSLTEPDGARQDFAVAPTRFLGNWGALTAPRLEFDYRHTAGQTAAFRLTVRILAAGSVFEWSSATAPAADWTHHRVPVDAANFSRTAGATTLADALANVERLEISMDQSVGAESNGLDNFALIGGAPGARPPTVPSTPVASTFDTGAGGWSRNYPPVGVTGATFGDSSSRLVWSREAGSAGALIFHDAGIASQDAFVAPPQYLGNLAGIANPRLDFDYWHEADPRGIAPVVVRLLGAGSSWIWRGPLLVPLPSYYKYQVQLAEPFFERERGLASFQQTLGAVERIEISADQTPGPETNTLDNVLLLSAAAPPLQPTLSSSPATLAFTAAAGGASPPAQTLTVSSNVDPGFGPGVAWTATLDPPAAWLSLSAAAGVTPSRVLVNVSLSGLAPAVYRGTITITAAGAARSPQVLAVSLTVTPAATPLPRINAGSIGNAAGFRAPLAPGSLATLFGANVGPADAAVVPFSPGVQSLPTSFRGVRVLVRDLAGAPIAEAPLLYVSSTQLNFQMPYEAAGRASVLVLVESGGQLSPPEPVALAPAAPGLFTHGVNRAVVQNQDFTLNLPGNAAPRGSFLIAYLTGPGAVNPPVPTGLAAPADPPSTATSAATATIGGVPATVLFLGLTPGFVGLAQANIAVSDAIPTGEQLLEIRVAGVAANTATVSIR